MKFPSKSHSHPIFHQSHQISTEIPWKPTILRGHGLLKKNRLPARIPRGLWRQPPDVAWFLWANVGNMLEECGKTQTSVGKSLGKATILYNNPIVKFGTLKWDTVCCFSQDLIIVLGDWLVFCRHPFGIIIPFSCLWPYLKQPAGLWTIRWSHVDPVSVPVRGCGADICTHGLAIFGPHHFGQISGPHHMALSIGYPMVPPNALVDHQIISRKIATTGAGFNPLFRHTHIMGSCYAWIASVPETSRFQHWFPTNSHHHSFHEVVVSSLQFPQIGLISGWECDIKFQWTHFFSKCQGFSPHELAILSGFPSIFPPFSPWKKRPTVPAFPKSIHFPPLS